MKNMSVVFSVGMGEMKVSRAPDMLAVYGIGSCVIVSLYDKKSKIGGMSHVMLPDSTGIAKEELNLSKFADTAVPALHKLMSKEEGIYKTSIWAKIVGGAEMFPPTEDFQNNIGRDNIDAVKSALTKLRVPMIATDVGGKKGRSVELDLETGLIKLFVLGKEVKEM